MQNFTGNFSDLSLSPALLRAIADMGYETPSPIQAQALPILLEGPTDFMGLAGTGTGKTAAFSIPLLERLDLSQRHVQVLILCPTRELAVQVAGQIELLGRHLKARVATVYGGASYNDQIRSLRSGAQIVVGTPGRVVDHIDRGTLALEGLKVLVLDEADEMLSMGFKEDLEKVASQAPRDGDSPCNIWLFSATMSREVRRVADAYLREPQSVQVNRTEVLSSGVEQYYYPTHEADKPDLICKLVDAADDFYGIIFCQTKSLVANLTELLIDRGYKVDCLHGDKDQTSRERTMQAFRDRKLRILVCTDVASRGLDVQDITHVINYSLPRELDSYVHRIGRTARSGKTGVAMNLVTPSNRQLIYRIEQATKSRMLEGRAPTRREIGAKRVSRLLARFADQPFASRVIEVLDDAWKQQLAGMTAEQVASHFLAMSMPEVFGEAQAAAPASTAKPHAVRAPASRPLAPRVSERPAPQFDAAERAPASRPTPSSRPAPRDFDSRERAPRARRDESMSRPRTAMAPRFDDSPRSISSRPLPRTGPQSSRPTRAPRGASASQTSIREEWLKTRLAGPAAAPTKPTAAKPTTKKPKAFLAPAVPTATSSAEGEAPLLNRRARRAAKFAGLQDQAVVKS